MRPSSGAQGIDIETDVDPAGHWRDLEARFFPLFERGACSFQEQRRLRVRGFARELAQLSDAEADAVFERYLALYRANWRACPGAAELIERALTVCRVGVLTNGDQTQQSTSSTRLDCCDPACRFSPPHPLGTPSRRPAHSNWPVRAWKHPARRR